jgi:hypothetical protein
MIRGSHTAILFLPFSAGNLVEPDQGCAALLPGAGSAAAGAVVTQATLVASTDALLNSIALP